MRFKKAFPIGLVGLASFAVYWALFWGCRKDGIFTGSQAVQVVLSVWLAFLAMGVWYVSEWYAYERIRKLMGLAYRDPLQTVQLNEGEEKDD